MNLNRYLILLALCFLFAEPLQADDGAFYLEEIEPVLKARCYACHGALRQEHSLRLDTVQSILDAGILGSGKLLRRITSTHKDVRMPPDGEPLLPEQVDAIRSWIASGASGHDEEVAEDGPRNHWSFQPVVRPSLVAVKDMHPIDALLDVKHKRYGLTPQAEASRLTQIRRLYFDLIGVPPEQAEMETLQGNMHWAWYEQLVDRLVNDSRYGERWGRHWMDIWRYSDWWGLGQELRNSQKHIWHWRDWIVESLNDDTPYDEMVRQMLAADELYPEDLSKLRATGYLARNWFLFNRDPWMDEIVEHVSKGFLGLTMNCSKCHDHKYDPIPQVDFYRMRAFFEPYHVRTDMVPGVSDLVQDGIPRVYDGLLEKPTFLYVRGNEKTPDLSTVITPGVPELLSFKPIQIKPVMLPIEAWQPARRPWVLDTYLDAAREKRETAEGVLRTVRQQRDSSRDGDETNHFRLRLAELDLSVAEAELDSIEKRATVLRLSWRRDEKPVNREKTDTAIRSERHLSLLKARRTLLEAEMRLMQSPEEGRETITEKIKKLQKSLNSAVQKAEEPIGPDESVTPIVGAKWTPTRFLDSRKDDPTVDFQSQSTGRRSALADWITDRRNPLTARVAVNHIWMRHFGAPLVASVFDFGRKSDPPSHPELLDWLASELMDNNWSMKHLHRVIVTSAAYRMSSSSIDGQYNRKKDPENRYWWRRMPIRLESQVVRDTILFLSGALDRSMGGPPVLPEQQASSVRRSLYFFHSDNYRNLFLATFDEASVKECYRREQSIVPQQALALTNSRLIQDATKKIAHSISQTLVVNEDKGFIQKAFAWILGIEVSESEQKAALHALEEWGNLPDRFSENAREQFIWALINHNDFVTVR